MEILEVLRNQTLNIRDKLSGIDEKIVLAESSSRAAEERQNRSATEISKQRALEAERKKELEAVLEKQKQTQDLIEDLDRQRQEAASEFMKLQEEIEGFQRTRREAHLGIHNARTEYEKESRSKAAAESILEELRKARELAERELKKELLKGVETYINYQINNLKSAFLTYEQKTNAKQQAEAFKNARHSDPDIARLCEERDELIRILSTSNVPGVKAIIQSSLHEVEKKITEKYPNALNFFGEEIKNSAMEEILFFLNSEGTVNFLLPVSTANWVGANEGKESSDISKEMCVIWNMIKEMGLKKEDGQFQLYNNRVVYSSNYDIETINNFGFMMKCGNEEIMQFVFKAVPAELQEALLHENQNI